jgi:glucan biosynthesis protein C
MMLLGLVLHSAASFTATPLEHSWPYQDRSTSALFDLVVFFIHLFRMPVFFVVAGFFAAMLYYRDGAGRFAMNRVRRVLLPLILFWVPIFPLVKSGFIFANAQAAGAMDWTQVLSPAEMFRDPTLAHLWFLWDLMLFYAAALLVAPLAERAPAAWRSRAQAWFGRTITSAAGVLWLALITSATLLPMDIPGLDTSLSLLPPVRVLIAYGVFFGFGWLLFLRRDVIEPFGAKWKAPMLLGGVVSVGYLIITVAKPIADPVVAHLAGITLAGFSMWLLIFGIVGAFVSTTERPSRVGRYLSDAAYWMYIVHLPIAIWMPGLLATSTLPAVAKFAITLLTVTVVTLVSYHFFVRATAIGALLNGRRYPRSLPAAAPVGEHVAV